MNAAGQHGVRHGRSGRRIPIGVGLLIGGGCSIGLWAMIIGVARAVFG